MPVKKEDLAAKTPVALENMLREVVKELNSVREANGGTLVNVKPDEAHKVRELNGDMSVIGEVLDEKRELEGADALFSHFDRTLNEVAEDGKLPGHAKPRAKDEPKVRDLGGIFLESEAFDAFKKEGTLDRSVTVPIATLWPNYKGIGEVPQDGLALRSALFDSADYPIQPEFLAQPIETLYQPNNIGPLFAQGTTDKPSIRYVTETVVSTGATEIAEAGTKPEAELNFAAVDEPVRKIAVLLPLTDESLEDVPFLRAYINARLRLFVQMREDLQLLIGNGTPPNLRGILNRSGINTTAAYSIAGANPDQALIDQTFVAVMQVLQAFLEPDNIVIKPSSWQVMRLAKDSNRNYLLGRPSEEADRRLWGYRLVLNANMPAISAGNKVALVGSFRGAAMLVRRSGIDLAVSDSHSTFFAENKVAVRAEERIALAVFRAAGFATVTSNA
jgi:HK97 family phage major capsid protein